METKQCTQCLRELPIDNFYLKKYPSGNVGRYSECKDCRSTRDYIHRTKNREEYLAQRKARYTSHKDEIAKDNYERYYRDVEKTRNIRWKSDNKRRDKIKKKKKEKSKEFRDAFLDMYGRACACCGETNYEFLTLEHKKGQVGIFYKQKESGIKSYRKAIQEYRPDLYEVLCMNCNFSKGRYGYCPHHK